MPNRPSRTHGRLLCTSDADCTEDHYNHWRTDENTEEVHVARCKFFCWTAQRGKFNLGLIVTHVRYKMHVRMGNPQLKNSLTDLNKRGNEVWSSLNCTIMRVRYGQRCGKNTTTWVFYLECLPGPLDWRGYMQQLHEFDCTAGDILLLIFLVFDRRHVCGLTSLLAVWSPYVILARLCLPFILHKYRDCTWRTTHTLLSTSRVSLVVMQTATWLKTRPRGQPGWRSLGKPCGRTGWSWGPTPA